MTFVPAADAVAPPPRVQTAADDHDSEGGSHPHEAATKVLQPDYEASHHPILSVRVSDMAERLPAMSVAIVEAHGDTIWLEDAALGIRVRSGLLAATELVISA